MSKKPMIMFISGSMFGQKSKMLIDLIMTSKKDNMTKYLVFKPTKDTRDGLYVQSRVYDTVIPALAWDQNYEDMKTIFNYTIAGLALTNPDEDKIIYFDETHFLSLDDIKFIVKTCEKYNVDLCLSGLETNFKLEYFESSKWLKEYVSSYVFFNGKCNGCGSHNAIYNLLFNNNQRVTEGSEIQPGDEEYKVFCSSCIEKYK